MKIRLILLFICTLIIWMGLVLRAAYLQILPNEKLQKLHQRQFNTVVNLNPRRGAILDRNGVELAASIAAYSLYADPTMIKDVVGVARRLSVVLGISQNNILQKIKDKTRKFVWISRRLEQKQKQKILNLNIKGLEFVEESRRIFPNENLLGQVLGFVGNEGQGLEGLESRFEELLRGEKRKVSMSRDALGRPLIVNGRVFSEAVDGSDIHLTIDSSLQYELESELEKTMRERSANSAVGVILEAKTSEILAIAAVPTFNPNSPLAALSELRRNRTITDPIEPGSTMKAMTVAAALRTRLAAPNKKFFCENGAFKVGKHTINEADSKHKWGWLTLSEILAFSSNIGSSKIAFEVGDRLLYQTFREFGFGEKTGVELPGETRGILPAPPWNPHLTASISFGHGIAATPLQIANAYAAIGNGGILRRPFIVKALRNKVTGENQDFETQIIRRVLEEKDAATLRLMLMGVTNEGGTGVKARVKGFSVAGKTGTAQKVDGKGGYLRGAYVSSFAGFVPANDPKYVIYIAVDDPKDNYYGSDVAAPSFARLAAYAVRKAGLSPTLITQDNVMKVAAPLAKNVMAKQLHEEAQVDVVPNVEGLTLREAMAKLKPYGFDVEIRGRGRVISMSPVPGTKIENSKKIKIQLE